jgi:spore germination protein GerM
VNGSALVELPSDFTDLGGQDQIFAAAQLVYTATAFPGVDQVSILVNGQLAEVPTANGSLSPGPLRRTDYTALAPR